MRHASRARGFSLTEILVVLAIAGLAIAITVPLVAENVNQARIRTAADQFSVDLRAARMIAVSKRATPFLDVSVEPDPVNRYTFVNGRGETRVVQLPRGVRIITPTTAYTVRYLRDGSVSGGGNTTVLRVQLSNHNEEEWRVITNATGMTRTTRARISS
ncbi:MAG TPA: prepilin-type N-terminal cleavage/methylation domain-containing protein [Candidatus Polarisedimenticolaceae bacterium]|nr:prepilin-type N-terminal cleavage/methylation domain-containing protein [Candidatus Polarisedimenticolaceae bacterium]